MQSHLQMGIYLLAVGLLRWLLLFSDHAALCKQVRVIHVRIWSQFETPRRLLEMPQVAANSRVKSRILRVGLVLAMLSTPMCPQTGYSPVCKAPQTRRSPDRRVVLFCVSGQHVARVIIIRRCCTHMLFYNYCVTIDTIILAEKSPCHLHTLPFHRNSSRVQQTAPSQIPKAAVLPSS